MTNVSVRLASMQIHSIVRVRGDRAAFWQPGTAPRWTHGSKDGGGTANTEIIVEIKPAPHTPWAYADGDGDAVRPNPLVVNVSPEEGIIVQLEAKEPGQAMQLQSIALDYCRFVQHRAAESPTAYEILLPDALRGDPAFFARADDEEEVAKQIACAIEGQHTHELRRASRRADAGSQRR